MMKRLSIFAAWCGTSVAQAHSGHGLPGSAHWHASDAVFFVGLALVVGLAVGWLGRRP